MKPCLSKEEFEMIRDATGHTELFTYEMYVISLALCAQEIAGSGLYCNLYSVQKDDGNIFSFINMLYVEPSLRRRGFATKFLNELKGVANEIGMIINDAHSDMIKLVEKLGFVGSREYADAEFGTKHIFEDEKYYKWSK